MASSTFCQESPRCHFCCKNIVSLCLRLRSTDLASFQVTPIFSLVVIVSLCRVYAFLLNALRIATGSAADINAKDDFILKYV